jgi:hypothetical protein
VIPPWTLVSLLVAAASGHEAEAGLLPLCGNRVVSDVVRRAGCPLGDLACWTRRRGYCGDHVEAKVAAARRGSAAQLRSIQPEEVAKGDVAVFTSRSHYAYVEAVIRDARGRPVAVDVSEYNYGTCWVDRDFGVTDTFKVETRRAGVALRDVDGGFLRPGPAAR